MEPLFKERQYFRQPWLWITLTVSMTLTIGLPLLLGGPGIWHESYLAVLLLPLLLPVLFLLMRLDTEIRAEGIYVRFFPFQRRFRSFTWDQINDAQLRKYDPLGEFGGWGIRGTGANKALNVSGDKGLQLFLKDGKKLLIGTRNPVAIEKALSSLHESRF